jgi:hypothetical protein
LLVSLFFLCLIMEKEGNSGEGWSFPYPFHYQKDRGREIVGKDGLFLNAPHLLFSE